MIFIPRKMNIVLPHLKEEWTMLTQPPPLHRMQKYLLIWWKHIFCELSQKIFTLCHISQGKIAAEGLAADGDPSEYFSMRKENSCYDSDPASYLYSSAQKKRVQDMASIYTWLQTDLSFFMCVPSKLGINLFWPGKWNKDCSIWTKPFQNSDV